MRLALQSLLLGALVVLCVSTVHPSPGSQGRAAPPGVRFLGTNGIVAQRRSTDCGPAALATLSQLIGRGIALSELEMEIPPTNAGTSMLSLRQAARLHGVFLTGVHAGAADLRRLSQPWIAHLVGGIGHYVVVEAVGTGAVTVADPAVGRLQYARDEFLARWSGYALVMDAETRREARGTVSPR